jgi:hypothetical protein
MAKLDLSKRKTPDVLALCRGNAVYNKFSQKSNTLHKKTARGMVPA